MAGVWLYLNTGWRFAEYKLRVAERWRTTHPILLHLLWPGIINDNDQKALRNPESGWSSKHNEYPRKISLYKRWSAVLFLGALTLSIIFLALLWLTWLATMGRFKPIHPEIWKAYRDVTK